MARHIIPVVVLVEVDDDAWAGSYSLTREGAVEDSENWLPTLVASALDPQKAEGLVLDTKVVDLLGWAAKMQATKVKIPGAYADGVAAERESWTDSLIAILMGEEDIDS